MTEILHSQSETLSSQDRQMLVEAMNETFITEHREANYTEDLRTYAGQIILEGTKEQASAAAEIILENKLHGNDVPEILGKHNFVDEYDKIQQLIGIAVKEPEFAHAIVANNIAGFHASNSSSLLGVLEHGLLSSNESRKRGIALGSGERTYTNHKARPFISFADWRDPYTITEYANGGRAMPLSKEAYYQSIEDLGAAATEAEQTYGADHPFSVNARLTMEDNQKVVAQLESEPNSAYSKLILANFPVVYGIDISEYQQTHSELEQKDQLSGKVLARCLSRSHYQSEFAVLGDMVSPDDVPVIAVPADRVDMVRKLVAQSGRGIDVYPLEPLLTAHGKAKNPYA